MKGLHQSVAVVVVVPGVAAGLLEALADSESGSVLGFGAADPVPMVPSGLVWAAAVVRVTRGPIKNQSG